MNARLCSFLVLLALVLCASCSSPAIARAHVDGKAALAFDGDLFTIAATGQGNAELVLKGSDVPLYVFGWTDSIIYASSQVGEWQATFEAGDVLTPQAAAAFGSNFSPQQLALLYQLLEINP